jgi:hypothetical protein
MGGILFAEGRIVEGSKEDGFTRLFQTFSRALLSYQNEIPTAYAIRSPLGSVESWVGRPRSVLGEAASILLIVIDILGIRS